jgi:hypothetical protein
MRTLGLAGAVALALAGCGGDESAGDESASADDRVCAALDEMYDVITDFDRFDAWFEETFVSGAEADDGPLRDAVARMVVEHQKNEPLEQADTFGVAWSEASERCDQL